MGSRGYNEADGAEVPDLPQVAISFLMFMQHFPLAWLRPPYKKPDTVTFFEAEEAGKRQLASLLDLRLGQLKFANAQQLKSCFKAHSGLELSFLPRQVIVLIHPDLRRLKATAEIVLCHSKPRRTPWFGTGSLSASVLLTTSSMQNNMSFLEQLDVRGQKVRQWPQLVQATCPQCRASKPLPGTPPAAAAWRCNGCRGDPEKCRVARRAAAAYSSGAVRAKGTLESMLLSAIKRGHAEAALLCANALAPLDSAVFLDAALRGRRAGIVATILSFSAEETLPKALGAVESHWLNTGRDFRLIRQQLQEARGAFFLNPRDEALSQDLTQLLRQAPVSLPRPAVQSVCSFVFCRDLSENIRGTLVLLGLTEGMHIRS
ncbi:unnamed protein product [Durusdinium trenchii]|uniref:Uncharacterized protein n=1 Tax=Durusdinium trenchii TaxID=1381693 RepID=A0ABP0IFQ9_9DINO